jgi:prolyl-tRNA synthetase
MLSADSMARPGPESQALQSLEVKANPSGHHKNNHPLVVVFCLQKGETLIGSLGMKYSLLFGKTTKDAPHDADSPNARLLSQAGYIHQLMAGAYTFLPLGFRVLTKIQNIIREEMNALGGQEITVPMLTPKKVWSDTERWNSIDVLFKLKGAGDKDFALAATAEDMVTPLVKQYVKSYKDFPVLLYQINNKFRNELRAKSGLLRGKEFNMKDLYSFHLTQEGFMEFYEQSKDAYLNIYRRCGLDAIVTKADGGGFTEKFSHEFQVPTESGEDYIYIDRESGDASNKEVIPEADWSNTEKYEIKKSIEVGNIFPLETRFSDAIKFTVQNAEGKSQKVIMGSYGIGPSRVMGSIVEVHHDEKGIVWPKAVAPFHVYLASLSSKDEDEQTRINEVATNLHDELEAAGIETLWDERNTRPGSKFADADLLGIPLRLVVSSKTLAENSIEWKERHESDARLVQISDIVEQAKVWLEAPEHLTSHE